MKLYDGKGSEKVSLGFNVLGGRQTGIVVSVVRVNEATGGGAK